MLFGLLMSCLGVMSVMSVRSVQSVIWGTYVLLGVKCYGCYEEC